MKTLMNTILVLTLSPVSIFAADYWVPVPSHSQAQPQNVRPIHNPPAWVKTYQDGYTPVPQRQERTAPHYNRFQEQAVERTAHVPVRTADMRRESRSHQSANTAWQDRQPTPVTRISRRETSSRSVPSWLLDSRLDSATMIR